MKILVFNWRDMKNPEAGGAELNIFKTMEEFKKLGHDITFFVGTFKNSKKYDNYKGMKVIRSGNRFLTYINGFFYYSFNSRKFDLVYDCVNGVPYWTPLYIRKKKVVLFHHVAGKITFKKLYFPMNVIAYAAEQFFLPLFYRKQKFIAVSEATKKELVKLLGMDSRNITVIHNGLDHDKYKPGKKSKKPRIVVFTRLEKYKRTPMLIDIFKEIKKIIDVEMFIGGSGADYEILKNKSIGLKDFYVLGFVDENKKLELMKSSWLTLSASMKEGWGLSILENNACGTPSVCFNVPGLNEAVINGKTGYLVNDKKEFIDKCVKILSDNNLRNKLSKNAIGWSNNFSWKNTAKKSLDLIKKL